MKISALASDPIAPAATVSVVILTHNYERFIGRVIQSVKGQTLPFTECVIIDNASSDATVAEARRAVADDPRFRIVEKSNEGPASARNQGYRELTTATRYVHWLDGDDELEPTFLAITCDHLDRHPAAGLVTTGFCAINPEGEFIGKRHRSRWTAGALLPRQQADHEFNTPFDVFFGVTGQGPFSVVRRSVFDRTTGWEEGFWTHEDSDMFCQMALLAEVHHLPTVLYRKREHPGSIMAQKKRNHYGAFRAKWDGPEVLRLYDRQRILKARRWYYRRHRPMRDLRIALKALRNGGWRGHSGRWAKVCALNALFGFLLGDHRLSNRWR
jgi:glycosyltransferase involved in cell wall biosynthesis